MVGFLKTEFPTTIFPVGKKVLFFLDVKKRIDKVYALYSLTARGENHLEKEFVGVITKSRFLIMIKSIIIETLL